MNFPKKEIPKATVMLTSMMDMFTIILVFLLYNFSAEDQKSINLAKDVELPYSSSEESFRSAVTIIVSQNDIRVDDQVLVAVQGGKISKSMVDGKKIIPLYHELVRKKQELEAKSQVLNTSPTEKDENKSIIVLQADRRIPFQLIDKVLKSAGMAGFPKSRFAVFGRDA